MSLEMSSDEEDLFFDLDGESDQDGESLNNDEFLQLSHGTDGNNRESGDGDNDWENTANGHCETERRHVMKRFDHYVRLCSCADTYTLSDKDIVVIDKNYLYLRNGVCSGQTTHAIRKSASFPSRTVSTAIWRSSKVCAHDSVPYYGGFVLFNVDHRTSEMWIRSPDEHEHELGSGYKAAVKALAKTSANDFNYSVANNFSFRERTQ